jgi:tuberous sclerosis protein 2
LTDGDYALIYRDDICHVVFHVATMMPFNSNDIKCSNKKRHIGNDYVTIVYSDNSVEFNPNLITGQFNVVHVIIYPLDQGFNRVEVKFREQSLIQLPNFGPLSKSQIVSDRALSSIVRLTAIHADLAARAYRKSTGEFVSNWEERLRQIHVIKSRYSKPKTVISADANEDISNLRLIDAMNDFFD